MFSETGNNFSSVTTDNDETDSLNIQCKDIEVAKFKNPVTLGHTPVNGINFPTVGRENDLSLCSSFHESNLNELCETINFTSVEIANDISVSDDCLKYECALDSAKIENNVQIDNTNDSKNPDQCQEPLKITSQSDRINGTLRKDEPILLSRNELESTLSNGCISQSNISDTRLELPKIQNGTVGNNNGEENDSSSKNSCDIHDQVKNDTENRSSVKRSATDEYSDSKNKRLKTEFTKFDEQLNPVKQESHPGESSLNGSSDFIDKKQIQNPNKLYQGLLNDLLAEEKDVVKEPEVIRNKLKRIKRKDLEDMIIDQVVHKLLYDHEIGYQRDVCKRVEQTMDGAKDTAAKLSQEIENLQSIVAKVSLEHRKRKSHLVFPTKVKRSVGVQVNKSYISQAFSATSSPESDGEFLTPTKFQRPKKDGHKPLSTNGKKPKHKLKEALEESPTKEKYFDLGKNFDKKLNSLKEDLKKNISEDKCSPRANVGKSPKKSVVNGVLKREGQRNKQKKNVEMVHKMVGSHKSTCTIPEEPETGHPAPLPSSTLDEEDVLMNRIPPEPILRVHLRNKSIILSWNINVPYDETSILSYQLFSYEETKSPPSTDLWQKIGSVKALELPMACTLTQFKCGRVYHFAVRAMTKKGRLGPFSQAKGLRMPAK